MSGEGFNHVLSQARQLSHEEQQRLVQELSSQSEPPTDVNGHRLASSCIDPREARKGPPKTERGHKLRELRKRHLQSGGRLLTIDEIDELVAENRGSLADRE